MKEQRAGRPFEWPHQKYAATGEVEATRILAGLRHGPAASAGQEKALEVGTQMN